jgi:hypothetical protein
VFIVLGEVVRILRREVDVLGVGAGLLMLSSVPRHGYVGRRGGRDVHQYRRRPTIAILFVGQTERNRHGVPSEFNSPSARDRGWRCRMICAVEDLGTSAKPTLLLLQPFVLIPSLRIQEYPPHRATALNCELQQCPLMTQYIQAAHPFCFRLNE